MMRLYDAVILFSLCSVSHSLSALSSRVRDLLSPIEQSQTISTAAQRLTECPPRTVVGSTARYKQGPLTPDLKRAWDTNSHPVEEQIDLGNGVYVAEDWRRNWLAYDEENSGLIDPLTGAADYVVDEIDGNLPSDLQGTLYRNGPGKFGVNGHRVSHVLDGDGLIMKLSIPPTGGKIRFQSRFVATKGFQQEVHANQFVQRGTFGTGPLGDNPGPGVNKDPVQPSIWTRLTKRAFSTDIKNTANTQVVTFGGKLLALCDGGLPYRLDPNTLETIGEDDMDGTLSSGRLPVMIKGVPDALLPDSMGGAAHTSHPKRCPRTGNFVGWSWSNVLNDGSLELTITEWSSDHFTRIASETVNIPNCEIGPHDMVLTESSIFLMCNSLTMNHFDFISGLQGPAASLKMDGRAPVRGIILPRPTSKNPNQTPMEVSIPACFSIHFSHGYEQDGKLISFFSGWPPGDCTDFLGAWGGFCPDFEQVPSTFLWRVEVDLETGKTVDCGIAPGSFNACVEHCVVHPNFITKKANNVYAVVSNIVGDSSTPTGYSRHRVEDGSTTPLKIGERNKDIDCYFYGTRYACNEALVVPKVGADLSNENDAYLLGTVYDATKHKTFVSIFDLERPLSEGPVCNLWLKTSVPHNLHGCFDPESDLQTSYFC